MKAQARERIDRQLTVRQLYYLEYDQEIGYIDRKINTYYNPLYSHGMLMVLRHGDKWKKELNRLLFAVKRYG